MDNHIYGFTGTRVGMTADQMDHLAHLLKRARALHHGDCIGADAEAHDIATVQGIEIVIHPPEDTKHRAFKTGAVFTMTPKPYLERNHDIVDACDVLIAAPKEDSMIIRSGTWATVRYAHKVGKPVVVLAEEV